jgi:glycosyltransferase involved in cell wall biosynthesis
MKSTIISAYDLQGMQVNGYLLHRRLLRDGHDSRMVVYRKTSDDERVRQIGSKMRRSINAALTRYEYRMATHSVLPILSRDLVDLPEVRDADVVSLQLIHNAPFFSLLDLPALSRRSRVVLSIHDMFMFTGHCVHAMDCMRWKTGCGSCPMLHTPFPVAWDSTAIHWRLRKWVFGRSDIDLVVGSPWQRERVQQSPILQHLPLHYIPYGVDEMIFKTGDRAAARASLGIPAEAQVIAFRSAPFGENIFKGTEYIDKALQRYTPSRETWLLTFEGIGGLNSLRGKYRFREMGWVNDQMAVAQALRAADVFLMPSIAEGFGLMAIEAMACGTPSIVFKGTALPETVAAPQSGLAVPHRDSDALALAVERLLADADLRATLVANGLRKFAAEYTFSTYAARYIDLFESLAERRVASKT